MNRFLVEDDTGEEYIMSSEKPKPNAKTKTADAAKAKDGTGTADIMQRLDQMIALLDNAIKQRTRQNSVPWTATADSGRPDLVAEINRIRDAALAASPFHAQLRKLFRAYDEYTASADAGAEYAEACRKEGQRQQESLKPRESFEATLRRFRGTSRTNAAARANDAGADEDFAATCNRVGREMRTKK
jgi:hypothetical protein